MITVTSLVHPTMIQKIRDGLRHAALGNGHLMGGHGNRVYIANAKGHNIMRLDWKGNGKYVVYGGAGWGQTEVTDIVKQAVQRGCSSARIAPRASCIEPSTQAKAFVAGNPSLKARLLKLAALAGIVLTSTAVQAGDIQYRTVQDNNMYATIYAQCMNTQDDPGVFMEESCRKAAIVGSKVEIMWDESNHTWVPSVKWN